MLETILVLIVLALLVFVIVAVMQPNEFSISRSGVMAAPIETVFEQVNTLTYWEPWSPWAKLDPNANHQFTGPASGIGAAMSWSGNNKVGVGSMTITDSRPYEYIRFKLEFLKPFTATNVAEFTFQQKNNQTVVNWRMSGTNNFIAKAMSLIMNCDKMVGGDFERGLAAMKDVVEKTHS